MRTFRRTTLDTLLLSSGIVLLGSGCYPGGGIDTFQETDTVLTIKAPAADFSAILTYSLPDVVVDLCDYAPPNPPNQGDVANPPDCSAGEQIDHAHDGTILTTVEANMTSLGYTKVTPAENPDVQLFVAGARAQIYVQYYYDYWYWYWGWYPTTGYYPPYDWYYPGVPYVQVYDVGTILITMVKTLPDAGTSNQQILWNAAINGLLGSTAAVTDGRLITTINQAYTQSPYLAH